MKKKLLWSLSYMLLGAVYIIPCDVYAQFDGKTFIDARRNLRRNVQQFNMHTSVQLRKIAESTHRIQRPRAEAKQIVARNLGQAFKERSQHLYELMRECMLEIKNMTPNTYNQTKLSIIKKQEVMQKIMKDLHKIRNNMKELMRK